MKLPEGTIVAATQNRHKIEEIEAITSRFGMTIISRDEAGVPPIEIVEDGSTFEENSYKKAYEIMKLCGAPTIADDSGLEVDCLGCAPGIYSARFAEMDDCPSEEQLAAGGYEAVAEAANEAVAEAANESVAEAANEAANEAVAEAGCRDMETLGVDKANNRKLIDFIKVVPEEKRTARFVSVITLVFPDGETLVARGTVEGHLITEERGDGGFGYDPMFVPDGYDRTFGQFSPEEKNRISHRANALVKLDDLLAKRMEAADNCEKITEIDR